VLHILRTLHQHTMAINLDKIDERHELETLPGVTLAIASETPAKKFNEDRLKALISRDPISINPKGKTIRTIVPRCTFYLAMNRDLTVTDYTEGFWRKVAVIPFNEAITAQNKINGFDKKITGSPEEMRRVLDWLLEGAIRIVKRGGRFCELPAASIEMMRDQRAKSDAVLGWMYDCEVKPCTGYADKGAIYQGFHEWCLREGRQPQGAPQFWTRLEAHFRREHKCGVNEKHASFMGVRVRRVAITGAGIKMTEAPLPPPPPRSETLVVSSAPSDCPF
jgi:phage/plasmid-associated DNA primase